MPLFFWSDLFLEARAEIKNNFVRFLVQMRTRKFAFEINWPLVYQLDIWSMYVKLLISSKIVLMVWTIQKPQIHHHFWKVWISSAKLIMKVHSNLLMLNLYLLTTYILALLLRTSQTKIFWLNSLNEFDAIKEVKEYSGIAIAKITKVKTSTSQFPSVMGWRKKMLHYEV